MATPSEHPAKKCRCCACGYTITARWHKGRNSYVLNRHTIRSGRCRGICCPASNQAVTFVRPTVEQGGE